MSERDTGFNNYALAHFMRSRHDTARPFTPPTSIGRVEDDLEFYFQACRCVYEFVFMCDVRNLCSMNFGRSNLPRPPPTLLSPSHA